MFAALAAPHLEHSRDEAKLLVKARSEMHEQLKGYMQPSMMLYWFFSNP